MWPKTTILFLVLMVAVSYAFKPIPSPNTDPNSVPIPNPDPNPNPIPIPNPNPNPEEPPDFLTAALNLSREDDHADFNMSQILSGMSGEAASDFESDLQNFPEFDGTDFFKYNYVVDQPQRRRRREPEAEAEPEPEPQRQRQLQPQPESPPDLSPFQSASSDPRGSLERRQKIDDVLALARKKKTLASCIDVAQFLAGLALE